MNGLSVVIPSKTMSNLIPCLEALAEHDEHLQAIVVDDGLTFEDTKEHGSQRGWMDAELATKMVRVIPGVKPFIFARNCNIGIQAAGDDDVVLLNDDALLESTGGFSEMQRLADKCSEVGLISATTNIAGNPEQHRIPDQEGCLRFLKRPTPGNSFPTVAFICVLIPRRTINLIGPLDERFGGIGADGKPIYGWEDNDYCWRLELAGLRIGICDGCYVDHASLKSTFRGEPRAAGAIDEGRRIYMEKWGSV